jgi:hypothetical protein
MERLLSAFLPTSASRWRIGERVARLIEARSNWRRSRGRTCRRAAHRRARRTPRRRHPVEIRCPGADDRLGMLLWGKVLSDGSSGAPVRRIQRMPSNVRRWSFHFPPRRCLGNSPSMSVHYASLRSPRACLRPSPGGMSASLPEAQICCAHPDRDSPADKQAHARRAVHVPNRGSVRQGQGAAQLIRILQGS